MRGDNRRRQRRGGHSHSTDRKIKLENMREKFPIKFDKEVIVPVALCDSGMRSVVWSNGEIYVMQRLV
jgi:hypothetical protein